MLDFQLLTLFTLPSTDYKRFQRSLDFILILTLITVPSTNHEIIAGLDIKLLLTLLTLPSTQYENIFHLKKENIYYDNNYPNKTVHQMN